MPTPHTDHALRTASRRFTIKDKLGSGGMGIVYRAYDNERDGEVALKTLRKMDGPSLYRFKREFRALADLVHPNLVTLHELQHLGDEWFFTMELVPGRTFLQWVRPHEVPGSNMPHATAEHTPPVFRGALTMETLTAGVPRDPDLGREHIIGAKLDQARLRPALVQLVRGVAALHRAGKLHCDLKPSNIMVDSEGRVVVCDFGLISEVRASGSSERELVIGTPSYMSPEQALGESLSGASDWYSVGVVLYEALTGRLPLAGDTRTLLGLKQRTVPKPAIEWDESVPRDLSDLCARLLERDPNKRADGNEILAVLGVEREEAEALSSTAMHVPFVGRHRQLQLLHEAYEQVGPDHSVGVFVHGSSGMGKSTLVRRFLEHVQADGRPIILEGRCYERETVPYKALDALVDALSSFLLGLTADQVEALIPRDIVPLARLFPVLKRVPAVAEPRVRSFAPPDALEVRRRAFNALRFLLDKLAATRPVIVFIDDLHWGDLDSAGFIKDLLFHPTPPAVLFLGTYRSEDVQTSPLLEALLDPGLQAGGTGDLRKVAAGALSNKESIALAMKVLGTATVNARQVATQVYRESGGNPLFIAELARNYNAAADPESGPASLDDVLFKRVQRVPSDARQLLTVIAVAGGPVPVAAAATAAGVADLALAMATLRAEHLIRTHRNASGELVECFHDRVRETVVSHMADPEAVLINRRLAEAFEAIDDRDLRPLVQHWLLGGEPTKAGEYALRAAGQAEATLAFARAAEQYGLALELLDVPPEKRRELLRRRADALANSGDLPTAARVYLEAAEGAAPGDALDLKRLSLEQELRSGQLETGLALGREVLASVGLKLPSGGPKRILLTVAAQRAWIHLRGLKFRERPEAECDPELLRRIDISWSVSSGLSFVAPMLGKAVQHRHLLDALEAGEPSRVSQALSLEFGYRSFGGGNAMKNVGHLEKTATALASRMQDPKALAMVRVTSGLAAFLTGRWKVASVRMEEGVRIMLDRCTDMRWEVDLSQIFYAAALLYLGEIKKLTQTVPLLLRDALEAGDRYLATGLRAWRSNVTWLVMDRPGEARRQALAGTLDHQDDASFHLHHYYALLSHCQIDLYEGNAEGAWARINSRWRDLERSMLLRLQTIRIESQFLRARCALALAAAGRDRARFVKIATRCARRIDKEKSHWGAPIATLIRAGCAQLDGDSEAAAGLLSEAARGFEEADMRLFAAICKRQEGQIIGGDGGEALVLDATEWMTSETVANPERMTALYAPGFLNDES